MLDAATATWNEVKKKIADGAIAVMGVGALEQHGPHLPLATDTIIATNVAGRLAEATNGLLLPPAPFGDALEQRGFSGNDFPIAGNRPRDDRRYRARTKGRRRERTDCLQWFNGHYGNHEPIGRAARELQQSDQFPKLYLDFPGLERLAAEICESKPAAPSFYRADEVETSIMLALQPGSVRMELAKAEYPTFPPNYGSEPIRLRTFCATGVFGDPTAATAEKGERLLFGVTAECMKQVRPFAHSLNLSLS